MVCFLEGKEEKHVIATVFLKGGGLILTLIASIQTVLYSVLDPMQRNAPSSDASKLVHIALFYVARALLGADFRRSDTDAAVQTASPLTVETDWKKYINVLGTASRKSGMEWRIDEQRKKGAASR